METPMLESELDDLVHVVADKIDLYADEPCDRIELNTQLSLLVESFGIQLEED